MDTKLLEKLGLSQAEIKVYITLFSLGSVSSGKIVKETGFMKSTVYDCIRRLQNKGLVSYIIKDGMKHFEAAQPERLIDFAAEQKRQIEIIEAETNDFVKELKKGFDILKPKAEAHVLEGIEGFKTMRRDSLRHANGEILLIGAISREDEVMPAFFKDWNKQRQKQKIMYKILHKASARGKAMSKTEVMGKYFETKFLPKDIESPAVINIYGDRVVNLVWKGNYPILFLLINKEIADSYRQYFHHLWKISEK